MENGSAKIKDVIGLLDDLSEEEKQEVLEQILRERLTIVFGGNNVINSIVVFQLNGTAEEMSKFLEKASPEVIGELLKALGDCISKRKL